MKRLRVASLFAERWPGDHDPVLLAEASVGPVASRGTMDQIARAESAAEGRALLYASPAFQRR